MAGKSDLDIFLKRLSAKAQQGGTSVDLGALGNLTPEINIVGSGASQDIPVLLPDGTVSVGHDRFGAGGKLGIEFETPGGYQIGAGAEGRFEKGKLEFPPELQRFGAPESEEYGTRGIEVDSYDAFLNLPSGWEIYGRYSPKTDDSPSRKLLSIMKKWEF